MYSLVVHSLDVKPLKEMPNPNLKCYQALTIQINKNLAQHECKMMKQLNNQIVNNAYSHLIAIH